MKVNGHGQSSIISPFDWQKMKRNCQSDKYKVMLYLLYLTGERIGAVLRLRVADCYDPKGNPRPEITYRRSNRKKSPDGQASTRQIPAHPELRGVLKGYWREVQGNQGEEFLFPSPFNPDQPISTRSADYWFRRLLEKCGLEGKGYSLHSFRRTFITRLHDRGISLKVIRKLTGHKSYKTLERYIEEDPQSQVKALELLEA